MLTSVFSIHALNSLYKFLFLFLVARCLSVEDFGRFTLMWTANLFGLSVLQAVFLNRIYQMRASESQVRSLYDPLIIIYSILIIPIICYLANLFYVNLSPTDLSLFILSSMMLNFFEYVRKVNSIYQKIKKQLVFETYLILSTIYLVISQANSITLSVLFTYMFIITIPPLILSSVKIKRLKRSLDYQKKLITFSGPLAIATVLQFIAGNFYMYLIPLYLNFRVLGELSFVRQLFNPFMYIFGILDITITRKLLEINKIQINAALNKILIISLPIFLLLFLFLYFWLDKINDIFFAENSQYIKYIYICFIPAQLLMFAARMRQIEVRLKNNTKAVLYASFLSLLLTLSVTDILLTLYQLWGALILIVLQQLVIYIVLEYWLRTIKLRE